MHPDPFTVAVVLATGAVTLGAISVVAGVAVIVARTVEAHQRAKAAQR